MYRKIQPKQIQLHTFSSSGIDFVVGENTVTAQFKTGISGAANFIDGINIDSVSVHVRDATNSLETDGSTRIAIFNGHDNTVSGTDCAAINSRTTVISGQGNLDLNGISNAIGTGCLNNTILAGQFCTVRTGIGGSVLIKDAQNSTSLEDRGNNTLNIKFAGGNFLEGNTTFFNDLFVSSSASGIFSGDLDIRGQAYITGSPIATNNYVSGYARTVSGELSSRLQSTGQGLDYRVNFNTIDRIVRQSGFQIISGIKQFADGIKLETGTFIQGTGSNPGYLTLGPVLTDGIFDTGQYVKLNSKEGVLIGLDRNSTANYNDATFTSSTVASFGITLQDDWASKIFMVHPSGLVWVKDALIINNPTFKPTSFSDIQGVKGTCTWDDKYFYVKTGEEGSPGWGRTSLSW